ncbi:hypothetical protein HZA33_03035 [Candidatus Pacearchaeota archaeon]|nr:hypothetical protein [Candidatus Pacearchaeota archaeon]
MQIIGFNLKKESIERFETKPEKNKELKLEIKTNIDVLDIKRESLELAKDKEVISFAFNFDVIYDPKVAAVNFQGNVLVLVALDIGKEIMKKWKKNEIDEQIRLAIFNTIMTKCNIRALQLEDDLALPSHIPLPRLGPQQNQSKNYAG